MDVDARPVVARFVGPMHRDALDLDVEAPRKQGTVRFAAAHVRAGDQDLHTFRRSQSFADVQQPLEVTPRVPARPDRPELDIARAASGLGSRPEVADREPREPRVVPKQHGVAEALAGYRTDLARRVEAVVDGTGQFAAGLQSILPVLFRES